MAELLQKQKRHHRRTEVVITDAEADRHAVAARIAELDQEIELTLTDIDAVLEENVVENAE